MRPVCAMTATKVRRRVLYRWSLFGWAHQNHSMTLGMTALDRGSRRQVLQGVGRENEQLPDAPVLGGHNGVMSVKGVPMLILLPSWSPLAGR